VSQYQKGKTNLDFTEARDNEWQWHQLGCMQVCTSLQTDNHASTPPLSFLQAGCPSCRPTNSIKALKARKLETVSTLPPSCLRFKPSASTLLLNPVTFHRFVVHLYFFCCFVPELHGTAVTFVDQEESVASSHLLCTRSAFTPSFVTLWVIMSKTGFILFASKLKVCGHYYLKILQSQQMSAAVKLLWTTIFSFSKTVQQCLGHADVVIVLRVPGTNRQPST